MNVLRAVQIKDGCVRVSLGSDVRRRAAERKAALRIDQQIAAAFDGKLSLADLRMALREAERRMGSVR